MKTHTFHVSGIHCKACKILIEDVITEDIGLQSTVQMHEETVTIIEDGRDEAEIFSIVSEKLIPHGYMISLEKQKKDNNQELLWYAIPLGLIVLVLFIGLQKTGILNFGI